MNHHIRQLIKRYVTFLVGLAVMALAVALMTKAALGISPIQSICYVVYLGFPQHLSLGTLIFCWNCVLFLLQPVILGKRFQRINLVQLPLSLFFGWTVDGFGAMLSGLAPTLLLWRILLMLCAVAVLALGISITLAAKTVMNPGEAFVAAVSEKTGIALSRVKVATDLIIITVSVITSFALFGRWRFDTIGIGTLTSGTCVGFIVGFFSRRIAPIVDKFCDSERTGKQ